MPQELIFFPMGAMALLTFTVLGFIPARRFRAAFAGRVKPDDFKYGESPAVPGDVAIPNRNYMNLLELPTLFYVGGLMYFVADRLDEAALIVAWAYVALRAIHSVIHLTYNNVLHRLLPFALSNFVLLAFWVLFFV
ncbi:MAG TPA: MAPEG family protein [Burkholderiales bacterium]|nr:MAPEG family protein [Burkholderiales bacterium]